MKFELGRLRTTEIEDRMHKNKNITRQKNTYFSLIICSVKTKNINNLYEKIEVLNLTSSHFRLWDHALTGCTTLLTVLHTVSM